MMGALFLILVGVAEVQEQKEFRKCSANII